MATEAAAKAAEVRKLKMEKQGVLGQINVIESKKKALVEIRREVENRCVELYNQLEKDRAEEEQKIRNRPLGTSEKDANGKQTEQSKKRRENQVISSYEKLTNKFFEDCESVKNATAAQEAALLAEIRNDQKILADTRTVSSMGDELKVSFGSFDGSKNGWISYISLYSDGVQIYSDSIIVSYEGVSGKKQPSEAELEDFSVADEYDRNIDMYNSLLTRGDPIIYFEIDYDVTAEAADKPSQYKFNFNKIRVINTVSGMVTQTKRLNKFQPKAMKPEYDLRNTSGIVEREKLNFEAVKRSLSAKDDIGESKVKAAVYEKNYNELFGSFVKIPGQNFKMQKTEVTQKLYISVMTDNPSYYKGDKLPVECVSWYDAIYFCNKLSQMYGLNPVYSVNGTTDVKKWDYEPHKRDTIREDIIQNKSANGFRLPTAKEWECAACGGEEYTYSGSNKVNEVAWTFDNSGHKSHPVAQKKPNGYGLYDMSGNVWEWLWDSYDNQRSYGGGSYGSFDDQCETGGSYKGNANLRDKFRGFRIVCSSAD